MLELSKETLGLLGQGETQNVAGAGRRTVGCVIALPATHIVCTFDPEPEPWHH